jgi:hypothetical protein
MCQAPHNLSRTTIILLLPFAALSGQFLDRIMELQLSPSFDNILNETLLERLPSNPSSFQPSPTTPFLPQQLANDQGISNIGEYIIHCQGRYDLHPPITAHEICSNVDDVASMRIWEILPYTRHKSGRGSCRQH